MRARRRRAAVRAFQLILAAVLGTVSMAPALAQFAESVCDADAQLLTLYPNQAAHDRLWQARLSPVLQTCAAAQARVDELRVERQLLDEEEGVSKGRQRLPAMQRRIDANDAARMVQLKVIGNCEADRQRLQHRFEAERVYLLKLWASPPDCDWWIKQRLKSQREG